jgi:hypothetical protein
MHFASLLTVSLNSTERIRLQLWRSDAYSARAVYEQPSPDEGLLHPRRPRQVLQRQQRTFLLLVLHQGLVQCRYSLSQIKDYTWAGGDVANSFSGGRVVAVVVAALVAIVGSDVAQSEEEDEDGK